MIGLERRRHRYAFTTWEALYGRYSPCLAREDMLSVVRRAIAEFIPRNGCASGETRLQMVRKCESSLKRALT